MKGLTYQKKKDNLEDDEITKDHSSIRKNESLIELNGKDNGYMKKRPKEVLIYHNEFDPHVDPEKYYYSLLLLYKPWRRETDLKGKCTTYKDAFKENVNIIPQLKAYDNIKQKIVSSRKKVEDEVAKKLKDIEEQGLDSEPEEVETEDVNVLDQVMSDFAEVNNVKDISTEEELNALVETLNSEQRNIYEKIIDAVSHSVAHAIKECTCNSFKPLYLYVSGFGGTGKSYLIKAIMAWAYVTSNILKKRTKIVLAAPTGISAAGINGMTLHSVLSLPIEHRGKMTYKPLTGAKLQQIQALMRNVHCVMIDEISMVSNVSLLHIHLRLTDIFGSQHGNMNWFGNRNVIVFGDLLQLPPVKGDEVFIDLSEKQVKAVTGMISTNLSLWSNFQYEELTINQRQKNDTNAEFKDCLMRIRIGFYTSSDMELLLSRRINVSEINPMESLVTFYNNLANNEEFPVCLLPTRSMVREFNDAILISRSSNKIEDIVAIDDIQCNIPKMKENAQNKLKKMDLDDRNTAGLEFLLKLSVGTRVMLRRNIDTGKKLVNGSTGTIRHFKYSKDGLVDKIVIKFDDIFDPVELDRDKRKIEIFEHAFLYREQFPLTCAYAITIHKSQGLSLKCVMADLGDNIFSEGQIYVALSRVQSLSGLHLININFKKIKASAKAIAFYASKSKQNYINKNKNVNIKHSEATWYTNIKKKKQEELKKYIIDKEIEDVPGKSYTRMEVNKDARKATALHKFKEGASKPSTSVTYIRGNLSSTRSQFNEHENVPLISKFSKFKNPLNNCWLNSVLQVIIHAIRQHEESILDMPLASENDYDTTLLDRLKAFYIPNKVFNVSDTVKNPTVDEYTEIPFKHLVLKAMLIEDTREQERQQDAGQCIDAFVNNIAQLGFLMHEISDQFSCNACNASSSQNQLIPVSCVEISSKITVVENKKRFSAKEAIRDYFHSQEQIDRNCTCGCETSTKKIRLLNSPNYIIILLKRSLVINTRSAMTRKITAKSDFFSVVQLTNLHVVNGSFINVETEYKVISSIEHVGNDLRSGHYKSYILRDNSWFVCNDDQIEVLPKNSKAPIENAYIFLLKKSNV